MEELFPDYRDKLIKAGALQTDLLKDTIIVRHAESLSNPTQLNINVLMHGMCLCIVMSP